MIIDHIIIFSTNNGQEADELVKFGFIEGSNRIHPGQGTRNRKFYFEDFFLEIVWVHNRNEILSEATKPTGLWDRANHQENGSSPFGICLQNTDDTLKLFSDFFRYRPIYLSEGQSFDIITNKTHDYLPWTCRLPHFDKKGLRTEPMQQKLGIQQLTKVIVGIPEQAFQNSFTETLSSASIVNFAFSETYTMTLEFDKGEQGVSKQFTRPPLSIEY